MKFQKVVDPNKIMKTLEKALRIISDLKVSFIFSFMRDLNFKAIENLWDHNAILFQRETDNLTNSQLNFLKALCHNIKQLSSAETILNYKLGTSANVIRIKEALENKEIIDLMGPQVEFMDPLFKSWLTNVYFKQ